MGIILLMVYVCVEMVFLLTMNNNAFLVFQNHAIQILYFVLLMKIILFVENAMILVCFSQEMGNVYHVQQIIVYQIVINSLVCVMNVLLNTLPC